MDYTKETTPYKVLKAYRQLKGVDQKFMADMLKINISTYSYKENGRVPFTLPEAKIIADFFGKSIEDIFFSNDVK
jgi:DNA-binding XRE family transcriptional regulator